MKSLVEMRPRASGQSLVLPGIGEWRDSVPSAVGTSLHHGAMKAQGFILSELWCVGPRSDVVSFKRCQRHICVGSDKIQRPEERL